MFVEHKEQGEVKELDQPAKLLLKTAALIELHGWCQNSVRTKDGRMCVEGAINMAAGRDPGAHLISDDGTYLAVQRFRRAIGNPAVFEWNDEPTRTKEEVVSKLRAVALGL